MIHYHHHYHHSTRRIRSIRLAQSFFSVGAVVFQEDPTKPDFTNPSTNSISDTWNRWRTRTRSKSKLTAQICFNQKVALNAKRKSYLFWKQKVTPSSPPKKAILTISIIWAGYMATHSSFLYFYGPPSSLIDRVWLFNSTATPHWSGWLNDNGWSWSGIGWNFLVIQLDFPENREK